jgi:hypothetical protein
MASEDKKSKSGPTPKKEAAPESKTSSAGAEVKADGGETAASSPASYSRGEGQKPVSKAYKDNWDVIFGKRTKRSK